MISLTVTPECSDVANEYQGPLEQIYRTLRLEPAPTRLQNIYRLQEALRSIAALIETQPTLQEPLPLIPLPRKASTELSASEYTLPPLYCPTTPLRALQPLHSWTKPAETDTFSSNTVVPNKTSSACLLPLQKNPLPARPHKRRKSGDESPASSADERDPVEISHTVQGIQGWEAQIGITPQCSRASVTDAAAQFQQQLLRLQISERKNNTQVTSKVNPADITVLIRFFFVDVFGEGCQKRIFSLVDEIIQRGQHQTYASTIAAQKANDKTLLPEVQAFFSKYSKWHIEEEKQAGIVPVIANTVRSYELYNSFFQLRKKATGPEGDQLRAFLNKQGFSTSVGVDIRTCILKYLSQELRIPTGQLNNALQAQQGIFQLAQQFGKGILVLLPKVASHRITRIGTQKMERITQVLYNALPEAVQICSAAEFLLSYISEETFTDLPPLLGQQVALRPQLSLLETFTLIRAADIPSSPLVTTP